jgi:hypothetical protein
MTLERLDPREMMAGNVLGFTDIAPAVNPDQVINMSSGISYDVKTKTVVIRGTTENDFAMATMSSDGTRLDVALNRGRGGFDAKSFDVFQWQSLVLPSGGVVQIPVQSLVERISFSGERGNDKFYNLTSLPSEADGGEGSDTLAGGSGPDRFQGGDGADELSGNGGDDILAGQGGNDTLSGGQGNDELWGDADRDTLFGGDDADWLYGGSHRDILDGGKGDDRLFGQAGNDDLFGRDGNDVLEGGADFDRLYGGANDDTLSGGLGADVLRGEAGNDTLFGGGEYDFLDAGTDPGDKSYSGLQAPNASSAFSGSLEAYAIVNEPQSGQRLQQPSREALPSLDIEQLWSQARAAATESLMQRLTGREVKKGFSLYNVQLSLAEKGNVTMVDDHGNITLKITLHGNYVAASATQPTFLGSWADPRVMMMFSLEISIPIANRNRLESGPISARMFNTLPIGGNMFGLAGIAVDQLFREGKLMREVETDFNRQSSKVAGLRNIIDNQINALRERANEEIREELKKHHLPVSPNVEFPLSVMYDANQRKLVVIADVSM